ncbi:adenosylcobinamide kinase, partial [Xanthomonas oryzae pv. oryzae]
VGVRTPGYAEHAQAWQRAALREASLDRLADAVHTHLDTTALTRLISRERACST